MALRCLFVVQGEGRGHLTQAMALRRLLRDAGHRVAGVVVGKSDDQAVPAFFRAAFEAPVTDVESPGFVSDDADRSVRPVGHAAPGARAHADLLAQPVGPRRRHQAPRPGRGGKFL